MTNRTVVDTVKLALYELSTKDPDEIARVLFEAGFRGEREVSWACPVARYLEEVLEKSGVTNGTCLVGKNCVKVELYEPDGSPTAEFSVTLPYTVRIFVDRFDRRAYPELEVDDEDD